MESSQIQINPSILKTLEQFSLAIGNTMIERATMPQRFNAVFLVMPFHHLGAINKLSLKFLPSAMPTNLEIIPTIIVKHLIRSEIPWAVRYRHQVQVQAIRRINYFIKSRSLITQLKMLTRFIIRKKGKVCLINPKIGEVKCKKT